eukprot:7205284-Alexandrium_andersonii.AAC.1
MLLGSPRQAELRRVGEHATMNVFHCAARIPADVDARTMAWAQPDILSQTGPQAAAASVAAAALGQRTGACCGPSPPGEVSGQP